MGVVSGCCCKEVYKYPHIIIITYPFSTCISSFFAAASLLSLFIYKKKFILVTNTGMP